MSANPAPSRRLPKDLAATLLTVACSEYVLAADGGISPYQWEAKHYGVRPRKYGMGPKTRGTMARSRSGQFVVSGTRLQSWRDRLPEIDQIAGSPVWDLLRPASMDAGVLPDLKDVEPKAYWSMYQHLLSGLFGGWPCPVDETQMQRLAACGTFDGIAGLWTLILRAQSEGDMDAALQGGRYLPPALALLACTVPGSRVAHLMLARARQVMLDSLRWQRTALALYDYDFPAACVSAKRLATLQLEPYRRPLRYNSKMPKIPPATLEWIMKHRSRLRPQTSPSHARWRKGLGPSHHPSGPLHPDFEPKFHVDARARIRAALGCYAE